MIALPSLLPVPEVRDRLRAIFPDGTPYRNYVTRGMAARTVFVMLYVGAVEGAQRWLRPDQVTRMTNAQAALTDGVVREGWSKESMRPAGDILGRWYAANTREPIRDETLRAGLVRMGAVKEREGLATTSPQPRYALALGFAGLIDPGLAGEELASAIIAWRKANLSSGALARVAIMRRGGGTAQEGRVLVTFPDGEARHMDPGPSSVVSKAVIEEFAARYLEEPAVIWLSESRNRVVARDDALAQAIGLTIQTDRNLPDLILVDLGPSEPLLVFVEVVASAGPVSEARQTALMAVATEAGFDADQVAFVTAYADRDDAAFKASVSELAWRSFAWFMSEPQHIVVMRRGEENDRVRLLELMSQG